MDNVSKMRSAMPNGLKPKDTLVPTKEAATTTPKAEKASEPRKLPDEKITNLYPIRLQIPIDQQQNLTLTEVTGIRRGGTINKGSVIRALINLLKDINFSEADRVASEQELEDLLRQKLKGI